MLYWKVKTNLSAATLHLCAYHIAHLGVPLKKLILVNDCQQCTLAAKYPKSEPRNYVITCQFDVNKLCKIVCDLCIDEFLAGNSATLLQKRETKNPNYICKCRAGS